MFEKLIKLRIDELEIELKYAYEKGVRDHIESISKALELNKTILKKIKNG